MDRPVIAVLSICAGGFVANVLPRGAFGRHDRPLRTIITGMTAGLTALVIGLLQR